MKPVLVTGSAGFMGQSLCLALRRLGGFEVLEFDLHVPAQELPKLASRAELVFHLAGVNRPKEQREFAEGNVDLTRQLCAALAAAGRRTPIVLSSSIQAELENPYGQSKREAEEVVLAYHRRTGAPVYVYRFANVFGKWSRPNYNTVVATFCHNISRALPVQISNPANPLRFVYIDDIVREFLGIAGRTKHDATQTRYELQPVFSITLGELHDLIVSFHENRRKSLLPDLSNPFIKHLYSTYISFYDPQDFAYPVELKTDDRGWLFELVKSPGAGQIFVSRTRPGITRGNHYHDTKIEKFCVVQGQGVIRFRPVLGTEIIEYPVDDQQIKIVDIPPGYTHSIENTGSTDMLTLFWANEIFDPQRPDTYFLKVLDGANS
jgi:UDP-2-acetamido-2,6-beta-L-arabino-hexul-4-ose reductase